MSFVAQLSAFCALVLNLVLPDPTLARYRLAAESPHRPVTIPRRRYRENGIGASVFSVTPYRAVHAPRGFALAI